MSTDPIRNTDLANPTGWNAYSYARNNPTKYVDPDGRLAFLPILAAAWVAYEVGSQVYDGVTAVQTITDPNATTAEKSVAVGGFALGVVGPGGGYGTAGKKVVEAAAEKAAKGALVGALRSKLRSDLQRNALAAGEGGVSAITRAIQKHAAREGSAFGSLTGDLAARNAAG